MKNDFALLTERGWKQYIIGSIAILWLLFSIIPFFTFAGRLGLIHDVVLDASALTLFLKAIRQIDLWRFALDILRSGVTSFLVVLAFGGWGLPVIRYLEKKRRGKEAPFLLTFISAWLLAEGIFIFIAMTWMRFWTLRPGLTAFLLFPGLLFSLQDLWRRRRKIVLAMPSLTPWEKTLFASIVVLLLVSTGYTSARLSYDASLLYFTQAKWMAQRGEILLLTKNEFSAAHLYMGTLYAAAIQLVGDQAARFYAWWHAFAILVVLLAIAREAGLSMRARLLATTLVLTSTAILDAFGDGKHDLFATAYLFIAIYRIVEQRGKNANAAEQLVNGFFLAISSIARPYNFLLLPVFLLILYGFFLYQKSTFPATVLTSLLWMALAGTLALVHYLTLSYVLLGDAFASLHALSLNASNWKVPAQQISLNVYRIFYPFLATFGNAPQSSGHISPLFLGFIPFLSFKRVRNTLWRSSLLQAIALASIGTLILWVAFSFAVAEIRYVFFLWYLLFLPLAAILEELSRLKSSPLQPWAKMLPSLILLFMIGRVSIISLVTYSPVQPNGEARCSAIPYCEGMNFLNANAPLGARTLIYSPYRYYLREDLFNCASYAEDYSEIEQRGKRDDALFWEAAYRRGFRYVLIDAFTMYYETHGYLADSASTPPWLHVEEVLYIPKQQLAIYSLQAEGVSLSPLADCVHTDKGWQIIERPLTQTENKR